MTLLSEKCHCQVLFVILNEIFLGFAVIKCHLSTLMGERKLKISEVARDTGLHRNSITLLYQETANRIDLEVVDKLCAYFGVGVGELFEFKADDFNKTASG
jgi:putative transcriptional regulator